MSKRVRVHYYVTSESKPVYNYIDINCCVDLRYDVEMCSILIDAMLANQRVMFKCLNIARSASLLFVSLSDFDTVLSGCERHFRVDKKGK